jgi:S1-C subfamily serine protease
MNALGLGFLSRYVVTLDFKNSRLYLKKGRLVNREEPRDASGLRIVRVDGDTVVESVSPGSPAAKCGIRQNDLLLEVDGLDTTQMRLHALRLKLCVDGGVLKVVVFRNGQKVAYTLALDAGGSRRIER